MTLLPSLFITDMGRTVTNYAPFNRGRCLFDRNLQLRFEEVQVLAFLGVIVAIGLTSNSNSRPIVAQVTTQQNLNMISGHVTNKEHNSISEIRVELLNEVDTVIQVVKTNGSGLFVFRKLSD